MLFPSFDIVILHFTLSIFLFFIINWLGKKSSFVGYVEFSNFSDKLESPIFNLAFRVVSPIVYLIIISALLYSFHLDRFVTKSYFIVIFYFLIRWVMIYLLNRNQLTNWWRQLLIGGLAICLAYILYAKLIVFKKSILPDPGELANELWIIIILFIYNLLNKLNFPSQQMFTRNNNYIDRQYDKFKNKFEIEIDKIIINPKLKCLTYAILIYEDFNRPKIVRIFEYISFFLTKKPHSLGVMQFYTTKYITSIESVRLGTAKIKAKYEELKGKKQYDWEIRNEIITDYNGGSEYLHEVTSIEEKLSNLVFNDPSYKL
jgi:hypothetical protein